MKSLKLALFTLIAIFFSKNINAQGVQTFQSIRLYHPTTQGQYISLLPPNGITSYSLTLPTAQGAANTLILNDGSGNLSWNNGSGLFWSLTGNGATTDGTHFIGTTNNVPFNIRVNNQKSGRIETLGGINAFGYQAGATSTATFGNSYFGHRAGYATTANNNTFMGYSAGTANTGGGNNSFFGTSAGAANTTSYDNTFLGFKTGLVNTTGASNTFVGSHAGEANVTGSQNTYIGFESGFSATSSYNVFLGYQTGYSTTSGANNINIGKHAGYFNVTGANNLFIGIEAGKNNLGSNNTFQGYQAGLTNTTGGNNTFLGYQADASSATLTNATAIGYNAKVAQSNTMILGGTSTDGVNVGIGLTTPSARLHVYFPSYGYTGPNAIFEQHNCGIACTQDIGAAINLVNNNGSGADEGAQLAFGESNNNYSTYSATIRLVERTVASNIGGLAFFTRDAAFAERMRITKAGNVGIGTIAPSQKLEIKDGHTLISNSDNVARELRFAEPSTSGSNYTAFKAQVQAANLTYTLPAADGTSGQVLSTNGTGTLSWTTAGGGSSIWVASTGANSAVIPSASNSASSGQDVVSGSSNTITTLSSANSAILGGNTNNVSSNDSGVLAGSEAVVSSSESVIVGGRRNTVSSGRAGILAGDVNTVSGTRGVVMGGQNNTESATDGAVVGGQVNVVNSTKGAIMGGNNNTVGSTGSANSIISGLYNTIQGNNSTIIGGRYLNLTGDNSFGINYTTGTTTTTINSNGIGFLGNINLYLANTDNTARELRFYEPNTSFTLTGTNYTAFKAGVQAANITYTLPTADGSSGQYLSTNGSGTLSWGTPSDSRLKNNIKPNNIGLEFIKNLKPVTYLLNDDVEKRNQDGFIAQEIDETLKKLGVDFSGLYRPKTAESFYSVNYATFVVPLVNAVKELDSENQQLKTEIEDMKIKMKQIEDKNTKAIEEIKAMLSQNKQ